MTRIVGVTGNIGSGKSTVARLLADHGAIVIDADLLAREAVRAGSPALSAIAARWPSVIRSDGSLDRGARGHIVFANAGEREALNGIVHPDVARLRDAELLRLRAAGVPIVVYDVPLLFEANLERTVDQIVVVDAPVEVRRDRLRRTRGLTAPDADAMISAQMPAEEKRRRAHHVIVNDGTLEQLADTVAVLWHTLAKGSASG
jgi:dephospho-CoA kinase